MHIFIDTNIYLSFYHYTQNDLNQLRGLVELIENGAIKLYLTDQVEFEYKRNREVKFSDAMANFKKQSPSDNFPHMVASYDAEYQIMREAAKAYKSSKKKVLEKLEDDYANFKLKADEIIRDLFEKSRVEVVSESILALAQKRVMRGNPPGKNNSYGDAIHWEHLLSTVPRTVDLYLIADDIDWRDKFSGSFSSFLMHEWKETHEGKILYYKSLSEFFREQNLNIEIHTESNKERLIGSIISPKTVDEVKRTLEVLSRYSTLTDYQAQHAADGLTANTLAYSLGRDEEINQLVFGLLHRYYKILDYDMQFIMSQIYPSFRSTANEKSVE